MHTSGKFRPANPPVCFRTVGGNRRTRMKPMQIQAEHAKFHTRRTRAHEPWADDPCQMKSIWASSERFDGRYYIRLDGNLTFCTEELTSMNITSLLGFKSRNRAESWILTLLNVSFLCFLNLSYTRTRTRTHAHFHTHLLHCQKSKWVKPENEWRRDGSRGGAHGPQHVGCITRAWYTFLNMHKI